MIKSKKGIIGALLGASVGTLIVIAVIIAVIFGGSSLLVWVLSKGIVFIAGGVILVAALLLATKGTVAPWYVWTIGAVLVFLPPILSAAGILAITGVPTISTGFYEVGDGQLEVYYEYEGWDGQTVDVYWPCGPNGASCIDGSNNFNTFINGILNPEKSDCKVKVMSVLVNGNGRPQSEMAQGDVYYQYREGTLDWGVEPISYTHSVNGKNNVYVRKARCVMSDKWDITAGKTTGMVRIYEVEEQSQPDNPLPPEDEQLPPTEDEGSNPPPGAVIEPPQSMLAQLWQMIQQFFSRLFKVAG